jgi:hypothetical protein
VFPCKPFPFSAPVAGSSQQSIVVEYLKHLALVRAIRTTECPGVDTVFMDFETAECGLSDIGPNCKQGGTICTHDHVVSWNNDFQV